MTDRIKILYLAANPRDTSPIRLGEEARDLKERIRSGLQRDAFAVVHYLAVRPRDLLQALQEEQPHILHFSGHGTYDNEIVLQSDDGASQPVSPKDLTDLVRQFKANLRLAYLSSCFGRKQARVLHQVLDFTIGMNKPMSDMGAVSFSAAFYQVLASGGSVRQAFESARLITKMEGRQAFEKSDLLIREGANADQPFVDLLSLKPSKSEGQPDEPSTLPSPSGQKNTVIAEFANTRSDAIGIQAGDYNTTINVSRN